MTLANVIDCVKTALFLGTVLTIFLTAVWFIVAFLVSAVVLPITLIHSLL